MERPTSVTVFGILNIVFAALGMFGILMMLTMFSGNFEDLKNPVFKLIHDNPGYALWMKISAGLGLAGSGVLLACGIGLLALQSWARILSIAYSIYTLVLSTVGMVINYICIVQPLIEKAHENPGPESAGALGGAIGGMVGGCVGEVYPILIIIFMFRRNVAEAFRLKSGCGGVTNSPGATD